MTGLGDKPHATVSVPFADLRPGEVFIFAREANPLYDHSGMATGPWRKASARKYVRISDGLDCEVGSASVAVLRWYGEQP